MRYFVDLQEGKILRNFKSNADNASLKWGEWKRSGRAVFIQSDIPPQYADYVNGQIVENAQKKQRYENGQADIAALKALAPASINEQNLLATVKLLVRVLKSKV